MMNADRPRGLVAMTCFGWAPVYTTLFAALALMTSASRTFAQSSRPLARDTVFDDGFTVGVRSFRLTSRDASTSPLRFTGTGASGSLDYNRTGARYRLHATVMAGALGMSSRSLSPERTALGRADFSLMRATRVSAPLTFEGGVALSGNVSVTRQSFAAPDVPSTHFRFTVASLGPSFGLRQTSRFGTSRLFLSTPVASVVDRPFSAVKSAYAGFEPHIASLREYRALSAGATYATGNHGRVGASVGAGFSTMRYTRGQAMHAVTSSVSAAVVIRSRSSHS